MEHDSSNYFYGSYGFEDIVTTNKYVTGIRFAYDMRIDSAIVASVYRGKGFSLRILMDKFIQYKGEELAMDTIYAVEKKPFLY